MAKIYLTTIDDVDIARIADLLKKRDIAPVDLMTVTPPDGLSARVLLNLSRQDIDANEYIKGLCKNRAGFYELPGLSRTDLAILHTYETRGSIRSHSPFEKPAANDRKIV